MKNELKSLYKKDKKLALEVAKVLGYKIKAGQDEDRKKRVITVNRIKKDLKTISKNITAIVKRLDVMREDPDQDEELYKMEDRVAEIARITYLMQFEGIK